MQQNKTIRNDKLAKMQIIVLIQLSAFLSYEEVLTLLLKMTNPI